jgi:multiple sugar transport system substrate-binding protein
VAAGAAAVAATGAACGSGSNKPKPDGTAAKGGTSTGGRTLKILQYSHFVPAYDQWFDNEYTKRWGEQQNVDVLVDHIQLEQLAGRAAAEVAAQRGHDLVWFVSQSAVFEDDVIDHREVVEEVEAKVGKMMPFVERSIVNPRTQKYFGFSDFWCPSPTHYRTDLWGSIGIRPETWEDVLSGGRRLKAQGQPVGIGMGGDTESNTILLALLHGFGGSIQDENSNVVINSRATVEAVKLGAAITREAMTDDVLNWDITSNNRYLIAGRGSLILNSIAAIRAYEIQDPALAAKVELLPVPKGPAGTASPYVVSIYLIWKFSENQEMAKQFLVDLATVYREPFLQSQYLQIPSFPGAVADLATLVATDAKSQPPDKYRFLADAASWTTNAGYPGHTNAAIDEVIKASLISQMFAAAARGEMSAEDAVKAAEAKIKPIYDKWRQQGKI